MAEKKRKSTGKKQRFEIFKRDKFTCQYCGRKAPDVVLQVDHISPVAAGGGNELLNLTTSCSDCNSGKGARELSDDSAVAKQRAELERLAERREQIDMMLEWSRGLAESTEYEIEAFATRWRELVDEQFYANERGYDNVKKWLRNFSLPDLLTAAETAAVQYLKRDDDGKFTADSVNRAWSKIPGIARISKLPAEEKDLYYCRGIIRNRFSYMDEQSAMSLLRQAFNAGVSIDELKHAARSARNWSSWREHMLQYTDL